jgi:hypothetical protein
LSTTSDDMRAATRADSSEIVVSTNQTSPDVDLTVGGTGSSATTGPVASSTGNSTATDHAGSPATENHPLIPTQSPERNADSN